MEKKYELIHSDKEGLYRIKALKSFSNVKKGDIGGYIQNERNLSQVGDCWIYDNAKVWDSAVVRCDANVCGCAVVRGRAVIQGNAKVCGNAVVCDNAAIQNNARIYDDAKVWGHAQISDNTQVYGDAQVWNHARIYDDAIVRGNAQIWDNATVRGNAQIWEKAQVCGDAIISSDRDYIVFKNWWSSGRYFTWTRSNNKWKVGCFYGTGEELIAEAYKDSEEKGREYERIVKYVEGEDKPSEWGIEDERNIRDCIFYLENAKKYFEKDDNILFNEKWFNLCIDWLKSLK